MAKHKTKYRKIRGINRRKRHIKQWGENCKNLDVDALKQTHSDYVKFWVRPWSSLSLINSVYPEPTGELKTLLIENLLKIYESWDKSLKQLDTPYYLQIWLFENQLSHSQVICAINDLKDFYQNTFSPIDAQPNEGVKSSQHYNEDTAQYLDRYNWAQYRYTQVFNMDDAWDAESFALINKEQRLGEHIIGDKAYQVVEIDKVWLISNRV
ncbi:hypothetical protein [Psychrobacter lutiphocae]|uniref:hypothetical protein n=1 Tax=Psychrobacter lutiphocae TaxID=540500 RepID=UPI00035F95A1|nr:hypothetical protein [Psychrobacter lutiphocae]